MKWGGSGLEGHVGLGCTFLWSLITHHTARPPPKVEPSPVTVHLALYPLGPLCPSCGHHLTAVCPRL